MVSKTLGTVVIVLRFQFWKFWGGAKGRRICFFTGFPGFDFFLNSGGHEGFIVISPEGFDGGHLVQRYRSFFIQFLSQITFKGSHPRSTGGHLRDRCAWPIWKFSMSKISINYLNSANSLIWNPSLPLIIQSDKHNSLSFQLPTESHNKKLGLNMVEPINSMRHE